MWSSAGSQQAPAIFLSGLPQPWSNRRVGMQLCPAFYMGAMAGTQIRVLAQQTLLLAIFLGVCVCACARVCKCVCVKVKM